jgi:phosphate-selective porin
MKTAFALLALIASLSLTCAVMAQNAPTTKPAKTAAVRGKVDHIDGMVITVKNKTGDVTVTTDANTTFTIDGKTAADDGKPFTIADVKAGERLTATPADGVATEVKVMSAKGKGKKKAAATTPPAN